jgi:iron complex transport system ATP-binding protein
VASQREEPVFPMQVRDYVSMGRLPFQSPWRAATKSDRVLVGAALERASIVDLAERSTDELSGGEWQRVRIARALAQGCQSVVLDEPTTHLDIAHEMHVFELARELAGDGRTILLISHQINLSARYADHLVLLHRGSVAVSGSAAEVLRADLMERVYEWPMVTTRDPAVGAPALLPLRRK